LIPVSSVLRNRVGNTVSFALPITIHVSPITQVSIGAPRLEFAAPTRP
jgi:hypothetical protein